MGKIIVTGHKSPDTDTVCSSIAFSWYLTNVRKTPAEPVILGELNRETEYVLDRFKFDKPKKLNKFKKGSKVAVVDTNNADELPENVNDVELVELVDHHKLTSSLSTDSAITVTLRPVACTATIIWQMIQVEGKKPPKKISGLMLCAILSDTLKFTSPTTTQIDKGAAKRLSELAGVDLNELSENMFDAKSDLSGMSALDILMVDSKLYEDGSVKRRYSVLETTRPENVLSKKQEILSSMSELRKKENLDHLFFFAVDILRSESKLITDSDEDKEISEKAFSGIFDNDVLSLPGVVSRKKQIIPKIDPIITQ